MKQKRYTLWPVLVLPALCAFSTSGGELGYHPAEGLTLTKSFSNDSELSLDDSAMSVNGQEMPMDMEINASVNLSLRVTDTYGAFENGQPASIRRTFDELGSKTTRSMHHPMMGDNESEASGTSELEGTTVVFTWNEDEGDYDVAFADDSSGDDELLEDLTADLDFAGLLPDKEVSEGDSWEVDPNALRALFAPGGSLKIDMESDSEGMFGMNGPEPSPDQVYDEFEGEVSAKLVGHEDEDGIHVAIVHLTLDISSAKDLTDLMAEMMENAPLPDGMEMEMDFESFDFEVEFEGEGEFRWDLDSGTLRSIEITGDITQNIDMSMSMDMGGQEMAMENSMTMAGTSSMKVEVEVES